MASMPRSARAQVDVSDAQRANARALGEAGVRAAKHGRCDEAIPLLTAADKLVHAPTIAEPLGVCLISIGKVIAGTELLNRVKREPLPPNPPPSWVDAQMAATREYYDRTQED